MFMHQMMLRMDYWTLFLFYLGRIKAMQLEYSEAHKFLQISSRKAPQSTATGIVNKSVYLNTLNTPKCLICVYPYIKECMISGTAGPK